MFTKFLSQQWISFWRGRNKGGSIIAKIFLTLVILYLLFIAIAVGFLMKEIITKFFPGEVPVHLYNGIILYYFIFDFLMRIQLQGLPTISIQPYLTLNIRKRSIVNFLNAKTLFSFFNVAPLFIFFPFCLTEISRVYGDISAAAVALCILSLITFNNFFSLWLKRQGGKNVWILISGVAIVLTLAALDYGNILSLRRFSDLLFSTIIANPYLSLLFVAVGVFAFVLNSKFLYRNLYLEELSSKRQEKVTTDYPIFNRFGRVGQLAALEFKLVLRHKRSRSLLLLSSVFILYGFLFFDKTAIHNNQFTTIIMIAIFITSIFQITYGQYMFAWQSNHFDGLMANRINFTQYIKAKFLLFNLFGTLVSMISLLYGFISWKIFLIIFSVYLYSIGFGSVIVIFFANYNRKRLDLTKGATFNYQGVGATQWIMGLPLFLIPLLIYLVFSKFNHPFWGIITICIFGIVTLAMQDLWVKWLTKLFIKQRYKIAEGFRE